MLGASAALGGFALVFFGLLTSAYQAYGADTPKSVTGPRKRAAWEAFSLFPLSVAAIAAALAWLVIVDGRVLYWVTVGTFAVELVAMVVVAARAANRLLS
jgi:hypothetical protein